MSYTESMVYLKPQELFNDMLQKCLHAVHEGYYEELGAKPHAILTLKEPLHSYKRGTKFLWVYGSSGFHHEMGIFNGKLFSDRLYTLEIIPVQFFFMEKSLLNNLNPISKGILENKHLRLETFWQYLSKLGEEDN